MSNEAEVISFCEIASPLTGIGVRLGEAMELVAPQFLIHECGFIADGMANWDSVEIVTPFWCLWYILGEGHWIEHNGRRWDLGPDCLAFGPAHVVISNYNNQLAPQMWMHFSLVPDFAFAAPEPFTIPLTPLLREQVAALLETHRNPGNDQARILFHHATALLNVCFAAHPLPLRVLPDALRAVLKEIESAPGTDLSNARLARLAGLSPSRFISWFELYMNESPAAYVRRIRYDKASRLLVFSDLSIKQIAAELGFPNRHYFSRAFAAHTGYGPATFRKKHRSLTHEA